MFIDDGFFSIIPVIVSLGFVTVFGIIIFRVFTNINQSIKNNNSPLLSVPAQVVTKRTTVQGDHSYTTYFVTFEVQSGDRMEFKVKGEQFGQFVEKDLGVLAFQGSRLISFERQK
ncbi:hypothetical protein CSE16_19790 [Solibacillus sp. R5-41]|uniref:DUF2500 domain-containing protein n=1 Tax=Solibacillus sp. R5-41 TaxID=2048654 RepID=UPI000C12796D|nr:DUF2500 domain-containing protein [Solibacillus sp. R5-41]ATP42072.1 hypothetical protein CSE16_19790 [Solibacillus sp. R5-41]